MVGRATIIVCDDEELLRLSLCEHLERSGHVAVPVDSGEACLAAVETHAPALVILDLRMPGMDGMTTLRRMREAGHEVPVVVITAHGAVESAVEATRLGASDFLVKPFGLGELTRAVDQALDARRLRTEVPGAAGASRSGYGGFIGRSPALRPMFETLERLEQVDAPTVLVTGESGTGKDLVARAIHARGPRRDEVFVEVDCASLPEHLIESELFGHERGAFTDARSTKRGLLEAAEGGVVFLDEIAEMSPGTQAKLLRALESRRFKRVGGLVTQPLDAAVIAATNRDLRREVARGRFREELYYRLDVIPVHIPPLRERRDDVPLLVEHFLRRFNRALGARVREVSGEAMRLLHDYDWPGNVRQLRNVLERLVILGPDDVIRPEDLPAEIRWAEPCGPAPAGACPFVLPEGGVDLDEAERGLIAQALERTGGNQSAAARLLGLSRHQLRYRARKHGVGEE